MRSLIRNRNKDVRLFSSHIDQISDDIRDEWLAIEQQKQERLTAYHNHTVNQALERRKQHREKEQMSYSKNFIPKPRHTFYTPETTEAKRFKESNMIGNSAQCYLALSPTLEAANEVMKRADISRMARNCILVQYADCVNQPEMNSDDFTFYTNEPASIQIINRNDIDYPTADIIKQLEDMTNE
jgi:hypothetical protein